MKSPRFPSPACGLEPDPGRHPPAGSSHANHTDCGTAFRPAAPSDAWWLLLRAAVVLIWLYQGLWHKILAVDARHLEIVAAAPSFLPPRLALGLIGAWETLFALALILRWRPRLFSWLQIATLAGMNAAGILFAADKIPDIGGMLTMNLLLALTIHGLATRAVHENP
jgi:uncharacterized membrane protein YphA (DoxX/SURF4 family)